MSENGHSRNDAIGGIVMLLIIAGLVTWGIGVMNDGAIMSAAGAGILLFLFGLYAVFSLGKE